jgi:hypothetical protein
VGHSNARVELDGARVHAAWGLHLRDFYGQTETTA